MARPKASSARTNGNGKSRDHMASIRAAEAEIEQLETTQHDLLTQSMAAVGMSAGASAPSPPVATSLGRRPYPLLALGVLAGALDLPRCAVCLVAPEIAGTLR